MLKGKLVLTRNFFGRVLNNAEKEHVLIIRASRRRGTWTQTHLLSADIEHGYWEVSQDVVALPWNTVAHAIICDKLPKWLYANSLKRR